MSERLELYTTPAALVAIMMMVAASVVGTIGNHPAAMAMVVILGVAMTLITIDTGSHSMLMFSAAFLAMVLALAVSRLGIGGALPWTVVGLVLLGFADATRLAFAVRRDADVEPAVTVSVIVGLAVVSVGSLATGGLVAILDNSATNASWLLVPLALILAVIGVVGLAVAMGRAPGQYDKRRWQPGERLLAPPREASDDPSFGSSMPPPPR